MWSYKGQIRNWVTAGMWGTVCMIRKSLPNNETGFVALTISGFVKLSRNRSAS